MCECDALPRPFPSAVGLYENAIDSLRIGFEFS